MSIILNQITPYPLKATYIAFKLTIKSNLQLMAIHFFLNELNFTCFQRQDRNLAQLNNSFPHISHNCTNQRRNVQN